jgi:hypothetical protein
MLISAGVFCHASIVAAADWNLQLARAVHPANGRETALRFVNLGFARRLKVKGTDTRLMQKT